MFQAAILISVLFAVAVIFLPLLGYGLRRILLPRSLASPGSVQRHLWADGFALATAVYILKGLYFWRTLGTFSVAPGDFLTLPLLAILLFSAGACLLHALFGLLVGRDPLRIGTKLESPWRYARPDVATLLVSLTVVVVCWDKPWRPPLDGKPSRDITRFVGQHRKELDALADRAATGQGGWAVARDLRHLGLSGEFEVAKNPLRVTFYIHYEPRTPPNFLFTPASEFISLDRAASPPGQLVSDFESGDVGPGTDICVSVGRGWWLCHEEG